MDLSYSLDILFMILAFMAVRSTFPTLEQVNAESDEPSTPALSGSFRFGQSTTASTNSGRNKVLTPSPSPRSPLSPLSAAGSPSMISPSFRAHRDSLAVPTITLTPDLIGSTRPKHGRKAVSFSLSSMDELMTRRGSTPKRPPTPFVRSPASPSMTEKKGIPGLPASLPAGVERMRGSPENVDGMGVKKEWLMPK